MHFSKKSCRLSSAGPDITALGSHYSANFRPIFNWFISKVDLKDEDSENIKAERVNTVVFNLHQINRGTFLGHTVKCVNSRSITFVHMTSLL